MKFRKFILLFAIALLGVLLYFSFSDRNLDRNTVNTDNITNNMSSLLTDPFLQLPTDNSVNVVWFTEFPGESNWVLYGDELENKVTATTTKLSRVREDADSKLEPGYQQLTSRDIWRHEATITGLNPNERIPYQVVSLHNGETVSSQQYTLTSAPQPNTPLNILLTSDHQLMPMTAANLQKVAETVGEIDAVFLAGDLVNIPDRASEWFDDSRGGAFFPGLQGKANYELEKDGVTTTYKGGAIIQSAPLFTALGNHEVMGRYSTEKPLNRQFYDAVPRNESSVATSDFTTIKNNSFNSDTYEEIFTLPQSESGGEQYYAVTFGDVRLIVLYVTNIWRFPQLNERELPARYAESPTDFNTPENWGYGQHIFEPIAQEGSQQYQWLETELQSEEFQEAKYKIVMFHHPPHTLGGNIVPPYTNPQQNIDRDENNEVRSITYSYPKEEDYIIRDLIPLLDAAGVQLVYYGHSHLWNRYQSDSGMHFLESSNVGNSYGAHTSDNPRNVPPNDPNNVAVGNPNGLEPIVPNIDPLLSETGQPLPYIASNDLTAFSILNTEQGTVSSYRFDTRQPDSEVIKFDEFELGE